MGSFQWLESTTGVDAGEKIPAFAGVQPLVLRGLMSTVSHVVSIEVLTHITFPACDSIFGDPETRLLMHIVGLLPWLCLQLSRDTRGLALPVYQQQQKLCSVAVNIAMWCQARSLEGLATVFLAYSHGEIKSINNLLACVAPLLCAQWFPQHSALAFGHLLRLLERGPVEYYRVILLFLKELLQHTPVEAAQSPHVYAIVSQLVESSLGSDALNVLEALLQSCNSPIGVNHESGAFENGHGAADENLSPPPTSYRARTGSLLHPLAPALGAASVWGGQWGALESGFVSSREIALQNTRVILERILENCELGRKKDYKRLVPFVPNMGSH